MKGNLSTFPRASYAAAATVTTLLVIVTVYIFNTVYEVQPLPFLDEIFHIPQAEKYCRGLFREVSSVSLGL
jgi:hypothetical protein